jgi:hypothetical protein
MHIQQNASQSMDAVVLTRLIHPEREDLPNEAAQALLAIQYDDENLERLQELVTKNKNDDLSPSEREELESYLRVCAFIDLMQAKARHSLKRHS